MHPTANDAAAMPCLRRATFKIGIAIAEAAIAGDHIRRARSGRCVLAVPMDVAVAYADDSAPWGRTVFGAGHTRQRQKRGHNG